MVIKAVLFDLDNTLTHRDQSIGVYSKTLIEDFRSDLVEHEQQIQKTIEIIRKIDNGGYPQKEYLTHPSIAASVADALLRHLTWTRFPTLEHLTEYWFEYFGRSAVPMAGAQALLDQLQSQQYQMAVISNGGHSTRLNILKGLGFIDYFEQIFSSEQVGFSKPNPEIFFHACRKLNCAPAECVYIGDHPKNDYEGALSAGLNPILMRGFHVLTDTQQTYRSIEHLSELMDILKY